MTRRFSILLLFNTLIAAGLVGLVIAQNRRSRVPDPPPIGGTAGLFMLPAQVAPGEWGCYLLDADSRTLATYRYNSRSMELEMVSGRGIVWDRRLGHLNTSPAPHDIGRVIRLMEQSNVLRDANPQAEVPNGVPDAGQDAGQNAERNAMDEVPASQPTSLPPPQ